MDYEPKIALSFSRLSDYEQCPFKFKSKYIDKSYPDDSDNPAFIKGNKIHKQLEDYVSFLQSQDRDEDKRPIMGTYTEPVVPMIDKLWDASGGRMFPEKQIAVDQDWELCSWYDKPHQVKYRVIVDCLVFLSDRELLVIDWKSGKVRPYEDGPRTQLKLTALILFNLYPKVEKITCAYMFVEHKETVKAEFQVSEMESIREEFEAAHKEVNIASDFPYKKNRYCNWCLAPNCPIRA